MEGNGGSTHRSATIMKSEGKRVWPLVNQFQCLKPLLKSRMNALPYSLLVYRHSV